MMKLSKPSTYSRHFFYLEKNVGEKYNKAKKKNYSPAPYHLKRTLLIDLPSLSIKFRYKLLTGRLITFKKNGLSSFKN